MHFSSILLSKSDATINITVIIVNVAVTDCLFCAIISLISFVCIYDKLGCPCNTFYKKIILMVK